MIARQDVNGRENDYYLAACFSVGVVVAAVVSIGLEQWRVAFLTYLAATVLRLLAGAIMNSMGSAKVVNAWNNKYHRFVVIALNSVVGGVLLGSLAWDAFFHHAHIVPSAFLVSAFVAYFVAAKFTKPNTFGARVRSATLTVVLIGVMAHLAFKVHWFVLAFAGAMVLGGTWSRLRQLQCRFGWADR